MTTLAGRHLQESTGRVFGYWVTCGPVGVGEVYFACAVSEPSCGMFGGLERNATFDGTVTDDPDSAPVELAIRSRVMGYIERTDFGEWRPPPPEWRGWYGLV
ncbi:MAG: hypothetical protein QM722_15680 [Piscinibacter sp.]